MRNSNPFASEGDGERKSAEKRVNSVKKQNPFECEDEEVTLTFQVPNGPNVHSTRPPPRPPKPVAAPTSTSRDTNSLRTPVYRVFGGATTEGPPSLLTRVSSRVMNSAPSSSIFSGSNRYSMVTTSSGASSPACMNNPFSDDYCDTEPGEEKSDTETRSPLRLSANSNSSSNTSSTRTQTTTLSDRKDNNGQRNSEEICNDTGIELMEAGRTQKMPPNKPTKGNNANKDGSAGGGPPKPAKPTKKKAKKIRKKITAVDKNDENAVVRHLLSELGKNCRVRMSDTYFGTLHAVS